MQEEHVQPHAHSETEFAAENLTMDSNQRSNLGSDQMQNRGKCKE